MIDDEIEKTLIYDLWRLWDIGERIGFTEGIANYYERLSKESEEPQSSTFYNTSVSMRNCHRLFDTLTWRRQKTKAIECVNLCKNKFCANCVKLIQATRLKRMLGAIKEAEQSKYLYHTVWTVRNVRSAELSRTLDEMNDAFSMLIRYFSGRKKIRGLDFEQYGFYAAIKSIECTYKDNGYYHPHFHAIFAFDNPFPVDGDIENKYSESRVNGKRTFSEDVVTMQKLWRLMFDFRQARNKKVRDLNARGLTYIPFNNLSEFRQVNDTTIYDPIKKKYIKLRNSENVKAERVTLDKIQCLPDGYSVIFDRVANGSYFEVFKYAFKCTSENDSLMSYSQFKTLRKTLYHKQTIQVYGAWHNITIGDEIDEDVSNEYKSYITELNRNESPEHRVEKLTEVLKSGEEYGYKIIASSDLNKYLPAKAEIEQSRLDIKFYENNPPKSMRKNRGIKE